MSVTKLLNAAGRGGSGPAETTAKLTDLSDSDIVIRLVNLRFDPKKIATKRFLGELGFIRCIN